MALVNHFIYDGGGSNAKQYTGKDVELPRKKVTSTPNPKTPTIEPVIDVPKPVQPQTEIQSTPKQPQLEADLYDAPKNDTKTTISTNQAPVQTNSQTQEQVNKQAEKNSEIAALNKEIRGYDSEISKLNTKMVEIKPHLIACDTQINKLGQLKKLYELLYEQLKSADSDFKAGGYLDGGVSFHSSEFEIMFATIEDDKLLIDKAINAIQVDRDTFQEEYSNYYGESNAIQSKLNKAEKRYIGMTINMIK